MLDPNAQQLLEQMTMTSVFTKLNKTLGGSQVATKLSPVGYAPAFTMNGGELVVISTEHESFKAHPVGSQARYLHVCGVNYHELGHVLFSPQDIRRGSYVQARRRFPNAVATLEDARIEILMIARFPSVKPYLVNTALNILNTDGRTDGQRILLAARLYLPVAFRAKIVAEMEGVKLTPRFEQIVREYLILDWRKDAPRLLALAEEFHDMTKLDTSFDGNQTSEMSTQPNKRTLRAIEGALEDAIEESEEEPETEEVEADTADDDGQSEEMDGTDEGRGEDDDEETRSEEGTDGNDPEDAPEDEAGDDADDSTLATSGDGDEDEDPEEEDGDEDGKGGNAKEMTEAEDAAGDDEESDDDGDYGDDEFPEDQSQSSNGALGGDDDDEEEDDFDLEGLEGLGDDDADEDDADTLDEAINQMQDRIMEQTASDFESIKAMMSKTAIETLPVLSHSHVADQHVDHALALGFTRAVTPLVDMVEPGWNNRLATGNRIDLQAVISGAPRDEIWQSWDEGHEEDLGFEIVVLLDTSGSMYPHYNQLATAANSMIEAMRRQQSIELTVMTYDDHTQLMYSSSRTQNWKPTYPPRGGNTVPEQALMTAYSLFENSTKKHKLLCVMTDGCWVEGQTLNAEDEWNLVDYMTKTLNVHSLLYLFTDQHSGYTIQEMAQLYGLPYHPEFFTESHEIEKLSTMSEGLLRLVKKTIAN